MFLPLPSEGYLPVRPKKLCQPQKKTVMKSKYNLEIKME